MSAPAPMHVFQTYVRASAEQVWQAITDPEFTRRYFHRTAFESSLEPGSPYRMVLPDGSDAVEGTIEVVEPNHRLVMTWRVLYDATAAAEPPSRVEWLLAEGDGVTKVTTIHRDLALSPVTSAGVSDGWYWILQSMKTMLETGEPLAGSPPGDDDDSAAAMSIDEAEAVEHRRQGIAANNAAWDLLGTEGGLTADQADDLLGRAYAASYHWRRAARRGPENAARGSWLLSRAHVVLGHGDLALHHADRSMQAVTEAGLMDFDLAYAHEARARALACLGRAAEAADEVRAAYSVAVVDAEDRALLDADLAAEPWYGVEVARDMPAQKRMAAGRL